MFYSCVILIAHQKFCDIISLSASCAVGAYSIVTLKMAAGNSSFVVSSVRCARISRVPENLDASHRREG